jgi:uroporphyrinogen decarboxylase
MLAALKQMPLDRPPIWMMRQAGRHLPRYRALRERISFLDLCRDEEANVITSAEPVERYDMDAAIVFNDILIPLRDMGMKMDFNPGPRFEKLIKTRGDATSLSTPEYGPATDVSRCIAASRSSLGNNKAILGFVGAPFTVAAFAITGSGPQRVAPLADDAAKRANLYEAMQEKLVPALADYAAIQVAAGADAIQIFESLSHELPGDLYRRIGLPALLSVVERIRALVPGTPIIVYGRSTWGLLPEIAECGIEAVSMDETRPLWEARRTLRARGLSPSIQGNLRPDVLLKSPAEAQAEAAALLSRWKSIVPFPDRVPELGPTGWVFNLGHGVPADANPETVQAVVDAVKCSSKLAEEINP